MNHRIEYLQFENVYTDDEQTNNEARMANRKMLAENVVGAKCLSDNKTFDELLIPYTIKQVLKSRLMKDEKFGGIEEYDNGYYNIFVKVVAKDGTSKADGIFKLFIDKGA